MTYDGVVLAGGEGRRLSRAAKPGSKPEITVGGRRLIDIAVEALAGAEVTVAVGARLTTSRPVDWTREDPVGGGPVAGLAAALAQLRSSYVVALAADLPFMTRSAVETLAAASAAGACAAVAVDDDGHDQLLIACYPVAALQAAMPDSPAGTSMRKLLATVEAIAPAARVRLGGDPPATWDCDTAADLDRAREMA